MTTTLSLPARTTTTRLRLCDAWETCHKPVPEVNPTFHRDSELGTNAQLARRERRGQAVQQRTFAVRGRPRLLDPCNTNSKPVVNTDFASYQRGPHARRHASWLGKSTGRLRTLKNTELVLARGFTLAGVALRHGGSRKATMVQA